LRFGQGIANPGVPATQTWQLPAPDSPDLRIAGIFLFIFRQASELQAGFLSENDLSIWNFYGNVIQTYWFWTDSLTAHFSRNDIMPHGK